MVDKKNIDGKVIQVTGRVFTLSNFISFSRFLVAIPVIYLHIQNDNQFNGLIIGLILYAGISDYLDGLVARKTNTVSEVGKMIDPISDKLCAVALFIYTVWLGWVPLWFLILNVFRDQTQVHTWLLYICTAVMVYSFFDYFNRYRKIMQGAKFN